MRLVGSKVCVRVRVLHRKEGNLIFFSDCSTDPNVEHKSRHYAPNESSEVSE